MVLGGAFIHQQRGSHHRTCILHTAGTFVAHTTHTSLEPLSLDCWSRVLVRNPTKPRGQHFVVQITGLYSMGVSLISCGCMILCRTPDYCRTAVETREACTCRHTKLCSSDYYDYCFVQITSGMTNTTVPVTRWCIRASSLDSAVQSPSPLDRIARIPESSRRMYAPGHLD